MKGMNYGIDGSGRIVVVLMIDGNRIGLLSQDPKFSGLNRKAMALRVSDEVGGITIDGTKMVKHGETDYPDAVIDTLEQMGIDVVGEHSLVEDLESEIFEGGPGSGFYGHKGRPGHRGGSLPGGGISAHGTGVAVSLPKGQSVYIKAEKNLKTGTISDVKHLGGGVTPTFKASVDGEQAVLKTMDNRAKQEIAAYEISKALGFGVVPPVVKRQTDVGRGVEDVSVMGFIEATPASAYTGKFGRLDMAKITAFDFVIGNQDRHPDNFIIDKNGKTWAIDNAFSMGKAKRVVSATAVMVVDRPMPVEVRAGLKRFVSNRKALEPKVAAVLGNKENAKAIFDRATELAGMTHFPKDRYSFYTTWKKKHGGYTPDRARSQIGEADEWLRRLISSSSILKRMSSL